MMRIPSAFTLVGFIVCLCHAREAPGAVIYVKDDATGTANGQSWANAFTDLQDALTTATPGDEIWVAAGTYKPTPTTDRTKSFVMKTGVGLYGGFAGTDETTRSQRNWVANKTILSGDIGAAGDNSDNSYHVVVGANNAVLDGFTIARGNARTNNSGGLIYGGGMFNDSCSPTVTNCIFSGNLADDGGGMYNGNSASPAVTNCTFTGNAADYSGGGIYDNGGASPTVINCTFNDNMAGNDGGGIYNVNASPTVTNCAFIGNRVNLFGGGINNHNASPMVTNCMFSGNVAVEGGGMDNDMSASPTLTNCMFNGNEGVLSGGGINNDNASPTVTNCTFSANTSGDWGGGMNNYNASPIVTNCTFIGNTAIRAGGGIYLNSNGRVTNSIFWDNSAALGAEVSTFGGNPTFHHCDIKGSGGSGTKWDSTFGTDDGGNIDGDPQFVNAANPAGTDGIWRTSDDGLALKPTSPCIRTGTPADAPLLDILGNPRLGTPDMGAYETSILIGIISPFGNQTFEGGGFIPIHWATNPAIAGTGVKLEIWNAQGRMADLGYDWNPNGEGTSQFLLPLLPEASDYRIRIISTWNPSLYAESIGLLTITGGPLRVYMPAGGDVWPAGTSQLLWWQSNPLFSGTEVGFELWEGGRKVADLGLGYSPNGEYVNEIVVPSVAPGTDYKVRVISLWNPAWFAENEGFITIQNPGYVPRNEVDANAWTIYR